MTEVTSRKHWFRRLASSLRSWLQEWRSNEEAAAVAQGIAALGLSAAEMASARSGSEEDIQRMLQRFGLDPASVPQAYLAALRDAERVCAHCLVVRRCQRFLAAPEGRDAARLFCPNAALFDQITAAVRDSGAAVP